MEISKEEVWKRIEKSELAKPQMIGDIDMSLMTMQEIKLFKKLKAEHGKIMRAC